MSRHFPRPDGPVKLTGTAPYAADTAVPNMVHAALIPATVPTGRVTEIDAAAASAVPGVVAVLDHTDLPRLGAVRAPPLSGSILPLQDDRVYFQGQPVGMVLAETADQARHAAGLVRVRYGQTASPTAFGASEPVRPERVLVGQDPDAVVGDVDAGVAAAEAVITATYTTADRHHTPVEPSATLAVWDGDHLTVYDATQWIFGVRTVLAAAFGLPAEQVRVVCPYVGGGFGCKGYVRPHQLLTAAAARVIGRPVKLVLTRAEMFTACGHQPATRQTVTLGARQDGQLTVIRHHSVNPTSQRDDYMEKATSGTRSMYASPAIEVSLRVERTDRPTPSNMRTPMHGPGMFALESAMDELAYTLGVDPVELRLRNEPATDPMTGLAFSSRPMRACLQQGAERFGWSARPKRPRAMRDGDVLIGWGMAGVIMSTFRLPASARVRLSAHGQVVVEAGTQEIGTGLPGVIATIAADILGVRPSSVEVRHGDTDLPQTCGTYASAATMSVGSAVALAAAELRGKLDALAGTGSDAERLAATGQDWLVAQGRWVPDEQGEQRSIHAYGAVFVEVRVDADLGLVRMPRCVAAYAAGRIINPMAARSQMIGGITWGYGQAVLEASVFEPHLGRFLSKDLTGYLVPVNADIGDIDAFFVEDVDPHACPLGAKGIGELGAVGVSAAIANAVFHATGIRVRDLPIRIESLIGDTVLG